MSRKDTHANLYPPGRTPTRASRHPGVGYWQLDNWPAALSLNHYQRADVYEGGREVADVLRDAYCKPTRFNAGTTGGFARAERIASLKFQLDGRAVRQSGDPRPGGWRACKGATTGRDLCWETAELIYIGDADIEGTIGTNAKSPLAVPFMSLTHSSKRFAVFPQSFTGGVSSPTGSNLIPRAMATRCECVRRASTATSPERSQVDHKRTQGSTSVLIFLGCGDDDRPFPSVTELRQRPLQVPEALVRVQLQLERETAGWEVLDWSFRQAGSPRASGEPWEE
ncbi:hypothetical protein [Candidatus Poriferisodalis sp.]|uniref:hypothetical protein n=1 Tax=Candidatus Poriferisodalis sp. TaxID=3101277 RepID=UPI003AF66606